MQTLLMKKVTTLRADASLIIETNTAKSLIASCLKGFFRYKDLLPIASRLTLNLDDFQLRRSRPYIFPIPFFYARSPQAGTVTSQYFQVAA